MIAANMTTLFIAPLNKTQALIFEIKYGLYNISAFVDLYALSETWETLKNEKTRIYRSDFRYDFFIFIPCFCAGKFADPK